MKRILVLAVLALAMSSVSAYAKDGLYGGFWHFGGGMAIHPQAEFNTIIEANGYEQMNQLVGGMIWGGGALINNFFVGGWGFNGFGSPDSVGPNKTISWNEGMGGPEFGYAVINTDSFHLIPTFSLIWGGAGITYQTNITFEDYFDNPAEFGPELSFGFIALSLGINALIMPEHFGLNLKAHYLYCIKRSWSQANFSSAPAIGEHGFVVTLEMAFGGLGTKTEMEEDYDEVPEREHTHWGNHSTLDLQEEAQAEPQQ